MKRPTALINTMVVEDHHLMACGIREFLATMPTLHVVATVSTSNDAQSCATDHQLGLVIMDIRLGGRTNGLDLAQELNARFPDIAILIYSSDDNIELVRQAIKAGARGYVVKGAGLDIFKMAIEIVVGGGTYLPKLPKEIDPLTPREGEVMRLIAKGKSNEEIRKALHPNPKMPTLETVISHRAHIMSKLGVNNAVDLYREAIKRYPPDLSS